MWGTLCHQWWWEQEISLDIVEPTLALVSDMTSPSEDSMFEGTWIVVWADCRFIFLYPLDSPIFTLESKSLGGGGM